MSRLPSDLCLDISRQLGESEWDLTLVMEILRKEIEARERSTGASPQSTNKQTSSGPPPTALSLTTATSDSQVTCVYCSQTHLSASCPTVKETEERKRIRGRCFVSKTAHEPKLPIIRTLCYMPQETPHKHLFYFSLK